MSLKERFYSILIVSATDRFTSAFADCSPKQDTTLCIMLQVSVPPNGRLQKKHLILLLSTPLCLMMRALVLRLTSVLPNHLLCCFW